MIPSLVSCLAPLVATARSLSQKKKLHVPPRRLQVPTYPENVPDAPLHMQPRHRSIAPTACHWAPAPPKTAPMDSAHAAAQPFW